MGGNLAGFATTRARVLVLAAAALLSLIRLDVPALWPPDEPRYALVAEEMRALEQGPSGLVLLHLHRAPYTQKPPLFFWLAAAAGAPLGRVTEFAARLPSALASIATIAATMSIGTLLLGRGAGTLAGLLLLTTIDWSYRARTVQLDTLLALFETTAILAFCRIEAGVGTRRRNLVSLHGSLALAVLAKGPIGWLVPLLAIAAHLAWERRLRELRGLLPAWGLALSILPGVAWIAVAVALAQPGFFRTAIVANLFGRAVGGGAHAQPFYYYLQGFAPDLAPWLLLAPVTVWTARRALAADAPPDRRRPWHFLLAWIATTLLFFSLASGKRFRYLMPIEPAFALLFAATLRDWFASSARASRALAIAATVLGVATLGASVAGVHADLVDDARLAREIAFAADAVVVAGAIAWLSLARRTRAPEPRVVVLAACVFASLLFSFVVVLPRLDRQNSPRPLAEAAAALAPRGEAVGLYRGADIADATAYYGERPVSYFNDLAHLGEFLAQGGRVIVSTEQRLPEVESVVPVAVRGRFLIRGEPWVVSVVTTPAS